MRVIRFLSIFILIGIIMSCSNTPSKNVEDWSKKEINQWFEKGEWLEGWNVKPDLSIDRRQFAIQYHKHPERWKKAFQFLGSKKPVTLKEGKYVLDGDNLFATIQNYTTKNETDTRFEAHKIYADIQYIVSGKERIGVAELSTLKVTDKYDKSKDIAFFKAPVTNYWLADSTRFFIFFPNNAHRPCAKADTNSEVRKVVVKVRVN